MNDRNRGFFTFCPTPNCRAIARVVGGNLDGIRVWLMSEPDRPLSTDNMTCECGTPFDRRPALRSHMINGQCPYMNALEEAVEHGQIPDQPFNDYRLADGEFQVMPSESSDQYGAPCENERVFISGSTGCGKSRWAGKWLAEYQRLYPYRTVTAFCHTPIAEDRAYSDVVANQLDPTDPEFVTLTRNEVLAGGALDGTICLFDDIDRMEGDAQEVTHRLLGQTLDMGRKAGIPVVFCNHFGANNSKTKSIHNAATSYVVFPRGGSMHQLEYMLRHHVGTSARAAREFFDSQPEWAYISRGHPLYTITPKRIATINALELTAERRMANRGRNAQSS